MIDNPSVANDHIQIIEDDVPSPELKPLRESANQLPVDNAPESFLMPADKLRHHLAQLSLSGSCGVTAPIPTMESCTDIGMRQETSLWSQPMRSVRINFPFQKPLPSQLNLMNRVIGALKTGTHALFESTTSVQHHECESCRK